MKSLIIQWFHYGLAFSRHILQSTCIMSSAIVELIIQIDWKPCIIYNLTRLYNIFFSYKNEIHWDYKINSQWELANLFGLGYLYLCPETGRKCIISSHKPRVQTHLCHLIRIISRATSVISKSHNMGYYLMTFWTYMKRPDWIFKKILPIIAVNFETYLKISHFWRNGGIYKQMVSQNGFACIQAFHPKISKCSNRL